MDGLFKFLVERRFCRFRHFRRGAFRSTFRWALLRSLAFAGGSTIGCFVVGFLLAYLIYRPFRGQALYYALFILPMLTVPIVIAYSAQMLLDRNGPLNDILSMLSGHEVRVLRLSDPNIALLTVTLLDIWNWTPFSFIIMLAGLSALPKKPAEVAQISSARPPAAFFSKSSCRCCAR